MLHSFLNNTKIDITLHDIASISINQPDSTSNSIETEKTAVSRCMQKCKNQKYRFTKSSVKNIQLQSPLSNLENDNIKKEFADFKQSTNSKLKNKEFAGFNKCQEMYKKYIRCLSFSIYNSVTVGCYKDMQSQCTQYARAAKCSLGQPLPLSSIVTS